MREAVLVKNGSHECILRLARGEAVVGFMDGNTLVAVPKSLLALLAVPPAGVGPLLVLRVRVLRDVLILAVGGLTGCVRVVCHDADFHPEDTASNGCNHTLAGCQSHDKRFLWRYLRLAPCSLSRRLAKASSLLSARGRGAGGLSKTSSG